MYLNVSLHNMNSELIYFCKAQDDVFSYNYLCNHLYHMARNTQQRDTPIHVHCLLTDKPSGPGEAGHTTEYIPSLFEEWCGYFSSHKNQISEISVRRDLLYGFSSLSEKTRKSNRLQMSLQR